MPRMADGAPAPGTTFEGPEKTLEIDFVPETWTPPSDGDAGGSASLPPRRSGLRAISRATLDSLLTAAQCCILSSASNKFFDSYVLSESSLFVYPFKMLIKTCGTTTLLRMLPPLLVETRRHGMVLEWVGYMRKNFMFPPTTAVPAWWIRRGDSLLGGGGRP